MHVPGRLRTPASMNTTWHVPPQQYHRHLPRTRTGHASFREMALLAAPEQRRMGTERVSDRRPRLRPLTGLTSSSDIPTRRHPHRERRAKGIALIELHVVEWMEGGGYVRAARRTRRRRRDGLGGDNEGRDERRIGSTPAHLNDQEVHEGRT